MPKTIRQAVAATKVFFVELHDRTDWTLFSQIRTKDHDSLPAVLTRQQVHDLLNVIRLRRYRTPIKLIYCCGFPHRKVCAIRLRNDRTSIRRESIQKPALSEV